MGDDDDSECKECMAPGGGDGDGDDDKNKPCAAGNNSILNTAGIDLDLDDLGSESDDNNVVNTWEGRGGDARKMYEDAMRGNIGLLRNFCDALEYQIQFRDPRFFRTLEKEGTRLFSVTSLIIFPYFFSLLPFSYHLLSHVSHYDSPFTFSHKSL